MGDHLKKVRPGDPLAIPTATFNTFVDAQDFLHRQRDIARTPVGDRLPFKTLLLENAIADANRQKVAARETTAAKEHLKSVFDYCTGDWYWVGVYNGMPEEWGDDWFYEDWRCRMRRHALAIMAHLRKD